MRLTPKLWPGEGIRKFGRNPDVGTGAYEVVWSGGGSYTGWLTAASAVRVKAGGNAADTAAGLGAQSVVIEGLDENWRHVSEEVATAGASASSATTTTFVRVYRCYVNDVGAYGVGNTGDVTIETTGGAIVALIGATLGQTQLGIYTIPAGKVGYLVHIHSQWEGGKSGNVFWYQRRNADTVADPFTGRRLFHAEPAIQNETSVDLQVPIRFPAKTDIWAEALAITSSGACTVDYELFIEEH